MCLLEMSINYLQIFAVLVPVILVIKVILNVIAENISVPHVRIQGSPDLHIDRGSMINLTCVISYSPQPPAYIFWYHNDEVVAYDSPR